MMNCCSTGIAISNIVHVNAPAHILWDVLTDAEAYPKFVKTIESIKVNVPSPSKSSSTAKDTKQRVPVGTQLCEERSKRKNTKSRKKSVKMRRTVTNVTESPSTNEYSISFSSEFGDEFPRSPDVLCNTSTLSIIPSNNLNSTGDGNNNTKCCELVGSLAVEIGGSGSNSIRLLCPILFISCSKQSIRAHAEHHFGEELRDYGTEAERRYQQEKAIPPNTT